MSGAMQQPATVFDAFERNHDGMISRAEFNQAMHGQPTMAPATMQMHPGQPQGFPMHMGASFMGMPQEPIAGGPPQMMAQPTQHHFQPGMPPQHHMPGAQGPPFGNPMLAGIPGLGQPMPGQHLSGSMMPGGHHFAQLGMPQHMAAPQPSVSYLPPTTVTAPAVRSYMPAPQPQFSHGAAPQHMMMPGQMGAPPTTYAAPPMAAPGSYVPAAPQNAFDMMDRNHDGMISRAEFAQGSTMGSFAHAPSAQFEPGMHGAPQVIVAPPQYMTMPAAGHSYTAPPQVVRSAPPQHQAPAPAASMSYLPPQIIQAPPQVIQGPPQHMQEPQAMQGAPQYIQGPPQIIQGAPQYIQGPPQVYQGEPQGMFEQLDANHDGVISRAEFQQAAGSMAPRQYQSGPSQVIQGAPQYIQGPPQIIQGAPQYIQGPPQAYQGEPQVSYLPPVVYGAPPAEQHQPHVTVAPAQYMSYGAPPEAAPPQYITQTHPQGMFEQLDANHDGMISRAEFQQAAGQPTYTVAPAQYMTGPAQVVSGQPQMQPRVTTYAAPQMLQQVHQAPQVSYLPPVMAEPTSVYQSASAPQVSYLPPIMAESQYHATAPSVSYLPPTTVQAPAVYASAQQSMAYASAPHIMSGGAPQPGLFEQLDQNHDGVLTRAEFQQATQQVSYGAPAMQYERAPVEYMTAPAVYAAEPGVHTVTYGAPASTTYAQPQQMHMQMPAEPIAGQYGAQPMTSYAAPPTMCAAPQAAYGAPPTMYAGAPQTVYGGAPPMTTFDAIDANHDGMITQAEYQQGIQQGYIH
mmetsp:Transcript_18106/g.63631  ORF Transcript_18106/g.63631 Transcript_18106/m.63631 type:complete len:790 (+) Transcript_18106:77-2446(+)